VEQVAHTSVKSPKATLDGTPLTLLALGLNVKVAATPLDWFNVSELLLTKTVVAALVLNVMGLALALAAIINIAAPAMEAARTRRLGVIPIPSPNVV